MSIPSSPIAVSTRASTSFLTQNCSLRSHELELSPLSPKAFHVRAVTSAVDSGTEGRKGDCGKGKLRVETIRARIRDEEKAGIALLELSKRRALEVLDLAFEEQKWKFRDACGALLSELACLDQEFDRFLHIADFSLSPLANCLIEDQEISQIMKLKVTDLRLFLINSVEGSISYRKIPLEETMGTLGELGKTEETPTESLDLMMRLRHVWSESQVAKVAKQLFESGRLKIWQEDFEAAEEVTIKALELLKARFPLSRRMAECLLLLGRVYHIGLGRLKEAEELYMEAVRLCEDKFPQAIEMIDACACLTGLSASLKDIPSGELWFKRGRKLAEEKHTSSLFLCKLYRAYGCVKRQAHDIESAFEADLKALSMSLSFAPDSWDVVLSYLSLGCDYRDLARIPEAEDALRKGAEFQPPCAYCVRCYLTLARMYRKGNRKEEGREAARKALTLGLEHFPKSKSTKELLMESSLPLIPRLTC